MIPNIEDKKLILLENFNLVEQSSSFRYWVELEWENDPGFARWLYEDCDLPDFAIPDEDERTAFLDSLSDEL